MRVKRQSAFITGAFRSKYGFIGRLWHVILTIPVCIRLARWGYGYFCPHLNFGIPQLFSNCQDDEFFLNCCLKELPKHQIIYLMKSWHHSEGSMTELETATKYSLKVWIEGEDKPRETQRQTDFHDYHVLESPSNPVNCKIPDKVEATPFYAIDQIINKHKKVSYGEFSDKLKHSMPICDEKNVTPNCPDKLEPLRDPIDVAIEEEHKKWLSNHQEPQEVAEK